MVVTHKSILQFANALNQADSDHFSSRMCTDKAPHPPFLFLLFLSGFLHICSQLLFFGLDMLLQFTLRLHVWN